MDKKAKKKIDVLHDRITKLRQQLAGAKKQLDDPAEVERLERERASLPPPTALVLSEAERGRILALSHDCPPSGKRRPPPRLSASNCCASWLRR